MGLLETPRKGGQQADGVGTRYPLAPAGPPRHTWGMDQREYEEQVRRSRRRRWTPLQIAVLILALLLAAPFVLAALYTVVWVVNSLREERRPPPDQSGVLFQADRVPLQPPV